MLDTCLALLFVPLFCTSKEHSDDLQFRFVDVNKIAITSTILSSSSAHVPAEL